MPSDKKVALVTGANRGIGFETARQLGHRGITVVVGARTQQAAKEAADKLVAEDIDACPVAVDITKDADRKAAAKFVAEKFGKLDILVNNAGVGGEGGLLNAHTIETSQEELESVFNTNLFSVVAITREFLPLLKKSPAGRIVNLASIVGSLTLQAMPQSPIAPATRRSGSVSGACGKEIRAEDDPGEVATLMISRLEGAMALDRVDKYCGAFEFTEASRVCG